MEQAAWSPEMGWSRWGGDREEGLKGFPPRWSQSVLAGRMMATPHPPGPLAVPASY